MTKHVILRSCVVAACLFSMRAYHRQSRRFEHGFYLSNRPLQTANKTQKKKTFTAQQQEGQKYGYDTEAFAIYDTIKYVNPPVHTVAVGTAWGEAAMLLASGEKGHRAALPSASIMIKQPIDAFRGQVCWRRGDAFHQHIVSVDEVASFHFRGIANPSLTPLAVPSPLSPLLSLSFFSCAAGLQSGDREEGNPEYQTADGEFFFF